MNSDNVKHKSSNLLKFPMIVHTAGHVNGEPKGEPEKTGRSKRFKSFKQVAHLMAMNYKWTKEARDVVQEENSRYFVTSREDKHLTFNVSGRYYQIVRHKPKRK